MLALNRRVIAYDHVTVVQTVASVDGQPIAHGHADRVGDEHRHAAGALRDQLAIRADESDGKVFVFVDVRAERRARNIRVNLISDRNDAMTDHFECDRIDGVVLPDGLWL